jgi:hypothetical protein
MSFSIYFRIYVTKYNATNSTSGEQHFKTRHLDLMIGISVTSQTLTYLNAQVKVIHTTSLAALSVSVPILQNYKILKFCKICNIMQNYSKIVVIGIQ